MLRPPFAWEIQVRREVVDDELARLRELPYSLWREVIGRPLKKTALGRDNRPYRIRTTADWSQPNADIRVSVTLESNTLRRKLMSQHFVITPDNTFRG